MSAAHPPASRPRLPAWAAVRLWVPAQARRGGAPPLRAVHGAPCRVRPLRRCATRVGPTPRSLAPWAGGRAVCYALPRAAHAGGWATAQVRSCRVLPCARARRQRPSLCIARHRQCLCRPPRLRPAATGLLRPVLGNLNCAGWIPLSL